MSRGCGQRTGGRDGFAAIEAHLPAVAALGVNAILLSPVTAASPGDFGCAVTDEFRLRTRFGSAAQLQSLVRVAHARGLRVLLDMAANHLSDQSPYYRDAQAHGRKSPYYAWFERDAAGRPAHYFDWTNLEWRVAGDGEPPCPMRPSLCRRTAASSSSPG